MRTDIGHRIYIHNTNCSLVKSSGTNLHTLRLRVTHGCNRIDLRTRIRIEPKLWDKRKQKVRQGYNVNGNTYNDINTTINTYMQYIDGYFHECELMKREPVLTDLRAKFNYTFKQTNAQRSSEFFLLFDEFIKEANQAAAEGIRCVHPNAEIVEVPVSDGGEGFMEAFHSAIGGTLVEVTVRDPLMRPVLAKYLLKDKMAVIEIAQASGLTLLTNEERNPMVATSYGTGQLVADAVRKGAEHIIVGLGGSATSDAGIGMLRALIDTFARHGAWDDIEDLKHVHFTIASDVKNPLCGEHGAAHVFAPQKGATEEMVRLLDERAWKFAQVSAKHFGYDRSETEGAGAAGGLGYAFLQYLNADCKPGIQLLLETIKFDEIVRDADLVITGEGSADRQTLMGKLPMGILAQSGRVPVCLIAGKISDREQLLQAGFAHVECINPPGFSLEEAMRKEVAQQRIQRLLIGILDPSA